MIYITGDCHGNFERFNTDIFPEQLEMNKEDYVIICGDFGGIWDKSSDSRKEAMILNQLECKSYTTLFVDGNHENFDRLSDYPVDTWNGGKVHRIRPSVIHLMRGQIFEIDGTSIFTFGGASSHDITGGILDPMDPEYGKKKKQLNRDKVPYRINHVSWWEEELPSEEEMMEGCRNLEKHDNTVDYIVTHCCASSTQLLLGGTAFKPDRETDYFEKILHKVKFKKWFFGHYHNNRNVSDREILLYEQIIKIL